MPDPTYDPRLAGLLGAYADRGVLPLDSMAVARRAIADARKRRLSVRSRRGSMLLAAVLVVAGGAMAAIAALGEPGPGTAGSMVYLVRDPAATADRVASATRVDLATGDRTDLVDGARYLSIAPDGGHLAYLAADGVHLVDTLHGGDRLVPDSVAASLDSYDSWYETSSTDQFVWSPGGRWVGWVGCLGAVPEPWQSRAQADCHLRLAASDGSVTRPFPQVRDRSVGNATVVGVDGALVNPRVPYFDWPDEGHLRVWTPDPYTFAADGSGPQTHAPSDDPYLLGGGGSVELVDNELDVDRTLVTAPEDWTVRSSGTSPTDRTTFWVGMDRYSRSISPDDAVRPSTVGSLLAIAHFDGRVSYVDLPPGIVLGAPTWSPDGTRLVVIVHGLASDQGSAAYIVAEGRPAIRIDDAAQAFWAPDGRRLLIVRSTDGTRVDVIDSDGSQRHPATAGVPGLVSSLTWISGQRP